MCHGLAGIEDAISRNAGRWRYTSQVDATLMSCLDSRGSAKLEARHLQILDFQTCSEATHLSMSMDARTLRHQSQRYTTCPGWCW